MNNEIKNVTIIEERDDKYGNIFKSRKYIIFKYV